MERCGFFDANLVGEEYDRVYLSQHFAAYFASFIGNGVFRKNADGLQVITLSTPQMKVSVLSGQGYINGYWYENTDNLILNIDNADGVLNRIDSVVLRLGYAERDIWLAVKRGTPAIKPTAPSLTRNADYYELQLATISIPAGSINITQSRISDTRLNKNVCGWVTGLVDQIDTGTLTLDNISSIQTDEDEKIPASALVKTMDDTLAILKRETMAPYGYYGIEQDIDELMTWVKAGEMHKFAIGDYFVETTSTGEKIMFEVADKNGYKYCGDLVNTFTSNHIICVARDCLETLQKFNETNTNEGGYAASLMPATLESIAATFSARLQSYMTTIRRMENNKGAWAWESRRIMLPSSTEIFGHLSWTDGYGGGPVPRSLALFTGGSAHIMKGRGFNKKDAESVFYWLEDPSATTSTNFCGVSFFGCAHYNSASYSIGVAPQIILS